MKMTSICLSFGYDDKSSASFSDCSDIIITCCNARQNISLTCKQTVNVMCDVPNVSHSTILLFSSSIPLHDAIIITTVNLAICIDDNACDKAPSTEILYTQIRFSFCSTQQMNMY
jgi:hypothetical protein